jgi:hypothetical protein
MGRETTLDEVARAVEGEWAKLTHLRVEAIDTIVSAVIRVVLL